MDDVTESTGGITDKSLAMVQEAERILTRLEEAFGPDDLRTQHAREKFQELIVDPSDETVMIGLMYLRWCLANPGRIGQTSTRTETCGECPKDKICEGGFILEDPLKDTWRPCHKYHPQTHEHWQRETGYLYNNR